MQRLILFLVLATAAAFAQNAGDAKKGKETFIKAGCYQCHGYDGHGGFGAKLAPNPVPLAAMTAYVRKPPPGDMPVYSEKVLPDSDMADIWAYLKSIPNAPAAKDVPLLNRK